ncbi:MAG: hypothetical protein UV48_C0020G0005 [Candidatus Azambacteria bacterium GW2011_GWA2_42_9]|uniref:Uncharacterized protein n=3 Tax=Candidatus Azamiibacteriota TaxID=1752741 RepID=A0A0G0ZA73_9BACT|nr:MAG: hypothetical protein UV07_C0015G0007 [Candidatus Azambacteria bacterium GW2011_GWB1_42_17]KKS45585.1 MAG: hypothetical protein UV10_C0019G0005 [Candidatus Azambacteria bacterium GW2011_GWA1_42_19]KKS75050.1 MAG: hypothetical protein UV48_C0020G0005 [Candidatus Azambacteria bacterium GW2011_GWA2_42_9]KKS88453.1 MAG: hypothetical protein UV62_C0007G0016 [Parcubacteria group bacterium GW2011_GWC1_43_11]
MQRIILVITLFIVVFLIFDVVSDINRINKLKAESVAPIQVVSRYEAWNKVNDINK